MVNRIDDSFIKQVNQHLGIAHKVCRLYFKDDTDRDDALQEMMYQLWRSFGDFKGRSKFSTWMYSVCLNTALTYRRKNNKRITESLSPAHLEIAQPPATNVDGEIDLLFEAVGRLSPVNKAITLLYLEDLSYEEIANITGLTKSNVSVRLVRIKKELEGMMKEKIKTIEDGNY
jgi:RNA polymerase sigma-70 factor (ECF subfamily)